MNKFDNKFGAYAVVHRTVGMAAGLRTLAMGLLLVAGALASNPTLAADEADLIEDEGVVQEISLAEGRVLISGFQYQAPPHADVMIRGNASSIAGLVVGMKVRFLYENFEGFKAEISAVQEGRVIAELEQLPDNVGVQEH